jgi:hypothetical protein
LTQDVEGLDRTARYRATVRLRAEGLGSGAVTVRLLNASVQLLNEHVVQSAETAQWVTVTLEAQPDASGDSLRLAVGFVPGTPSGAVVWCDEATLFRQTDPH